MFSMQIFAHMLILFSSLRGKNCISFIYVNIYLLFNTTEFALIYVEVTGVNNGKIAVKQEKYVDVH